MKKFALLIVLLIPSFTYSQSSYNPEKWSYHFFYELSSGIKHERYNDDYYFTSNLQAIGMRFMYMESLYTKFGLGLTLISAPDFAFSCYLPASLGYIITPGRKIKPFIEAGVYGGEAFFGQIKGGIIIDIDGMDLEIGISNRRSSRIKIDTETKAYNVIELNIAIHYNL